MSVDRTAVRIAAVGDLHVGDDEFGSGLANVAERADLLLLAGDLTRSGQPDEGALLASELADLGLPVVAVLGNHDVHSGREAEVAGHLRRSGVHVLEGQAFVVHLDGVSVGVVGSKGFGGGFAGACATDFGEQLMKLFVRETHRIADNVEMLLGQLDTEVRVVLYHYSPIPETLHGEPLEIYPFLGSYLLGEAVDRAGADLVLHGHAHRGVEHGTTPGGVPVRNVARAVIRHPYRVYEIPVHQGARPAVVGAR